MIFIMKSNRFEFNLVYGEFAIAFMWILFHFEPSQ